MPLYFAYGANMDMGAMAKRCPASKALGLARLPRHRWFISSDGYANVARDPRREVHGVLWDLALADVTVLDRFEDVPRLYRKMLQPVIGSMGIRKALIYVGRATDMGRPRTGYLADVIKAAETAQLPISAINDMRHFTDARPARTESAMKAPGLVAKSQKWVWTP